jgi:hypothetical protein
MDPGTGSAKAELSTLPESGTFYFALTQQFPLCRGHVRSSYLGQVESSY